MIKQYTHDELLRHHRQVEIAIMELNYDPEHIDSPLRSRLAKREEEFRMELARRATMRQTPN